MTTNDVEKQVEEEIETIRSKFATTALTSQREVVENLGLTLEKIRKDAKARSGICQEIKHILAEEIKRELISEKTIENYCKQEWKHPQKSQAGKKGAEAKSAEIFSAEPLLVTTDGSVEVDRDIQQRIDTGEITAQQAERIFKMIRKFEPETGKPISPEKKEEVLDYLAGEKNQIKQIERQNAKIAEKLLTGKRFEPEVPDNYREYLEANENIRVYDALFSAILKMLQIINSPLDGAKDDGTKLQMEWMKIVREVGGTPRDAEWRDKIGSLKQVSAYVDRLMGSLRQIQPVFQNEIKNRRQIDDEKLR